MENQIDKQNEIREIKLVDETLNFKFLSNGAAKEIILIKAGPAFIAGTYFSDEYPSEGDIERALDYIENELTKHKELKSNGETLTCNSTLLADTLFVKEKSMLSRKRIEEEFDKYVDCAFGEPAPILGIDYSQEKLSHLLIVRSVMYYLGFEEIELSR